MACSEYSEYSDYSDEEMLWGCLALQHGLGPMGFATLMRGLGSPKAVYQASSADLAALDPNLNQECLNSILGGPDLAKWNRLIQRCAELGAQIVFAGKPGYPSPLQDLSAPPPILFMQGEWLPEDARAVAMVGTRKPSPYGREVAFHLARDLARAGATVVSGFAIGIDAEAHAGALAGAGRTFAVLGCGLDVDYPSSNQELRTRIANNGMLLSEFPPGEQPQRHHFPRRNRLISALARATIVVEAGMRSGSLLTAAYARRQGKALFAVPGSIFEPTTAGTHALLRRGVNLAAAAADILPSLDPTFKPHPTHLSRPPRSTRAVRISKPDLSPLEKDPVLALWRGEETCGLDRLEERARHSGLWPVGKALAGLLSSLLQMEIRGCVQRLPGPAFRINFSVR